jgi:enoyl-CoA hydratase/carnithine racemase
MNDRINLRIADGIATVFLNRPTKLNALDPAMFAALADAIHRIGETTGIRAVVLSGEGRAFCAGLDMDCMAAGGTGFALDRREYGPANLLQQVAWGWRSLPVPVIAAVHGVAFGGGLQIMSGADIRICHPATRLAIRETHWGLIPDMAGFATWRTQVRDDLLRELVYTAREFEGAEALQLGFATQLADDPHGAALELAEAIAARSPDAIRAAKRLLNLPTHDPAAVLMAESVEQQELIGSPNQIEAVRANLENRLPAFR